MRLKLNFMCEFGVCLLNASVCFRVIHSLTITFCMTDYLSRIITSHSAHACDGQPLRLHCPRHSTISIQSAFYGSDEARLCGAHSPLGAHNHSCSAFTALQVLFMYGINSTFHSRWVSWEWVCAHQFFCWFTGEVSSPCVFRFVLNTLSWDELAGKCCLQFKVNAGLWRHQTLSLSASFLFTSDSHCSHRGL